MVIYGACVVLSGMASSTTVSKNVNWSAAFVAFSRGSATAEICREFGVSVPELKQRAKVEAWESLCERLPVSADILTTDMGQNSLQSLERLQANRERNLEIIDKLREDLERVVRDLVAEKLTIVEFKATKDGLHEVERPLGVKDRVDLANYADKIFKMGYEALGDSTAKDGAGVNGKSGTGSAGQVIFQINMPAAVAAPRPVKDRVAEVAVDI